MQDVDQSAYSSTVELPSRGFLYGEKLPEGKMSIRTMTTNEEKFIYSGRGSMPEKMDKLLARCCSFPQGFKPGDLLVSDRLFLLVKIRLASFPGIPYSFPFQCENENCGEQNNWPCDLTQLEVDYYDDEKEEPFYVDLPVCKKTIGFRMLRGKDEAQIFAFSKRQKMKKRRDKTEDATYTYSLARRILTIDGNEVDQATALQFLERDFVSADSLAFKTAIEKNDCGLNTDIVIECPDCGFMFEKDMPFTKEFLRPESG